jgi:hypothetical protein
VRSLGELRKAPRGKPVTAAARNVRKSGGLAERLKNHLVGADAGWSMPHSKQSDGKEGARAGVRCSPRRSLQPPERGDGSLLLQTVYGGEGKQHTHKLGRLQTALKAHGVGSVTAGSSGPRSFMPQPPQEQRFHRHNPLRLLLRGGVEVHPLALPLQGSRSFRRIGWSWRHDGAGEWSIPRPSSRRARDRQWI